MCRLCERGKHAYQLNQRVVTKEKINSVGCNTITILNHEINKYKKLI